MGERTRAQKALYIAAGLCLAASIFCGFVPVGYQMSALVFLALSVWLALFALFFPVLSGLPVDNAKTSALLGWLPTWPI